ncbi:hypothetical protein [Pseudorhodobacter sp.]|uniref:hypothetical protein n=1 Tax=Pseudorhodobacter sp. TaxID=1934400 RepID=UPI0039E4809A
MRMDTNQFVLMFAAFMVIVTAMMTVSQWDQDSPAPQRFLQYVCRFESFCWGGDCFATLPPALSIVPMAEDGAAYVSHADRPTTWHDLETVSAREWIGPVGKSGIMRLVLDEKDVLTYTEHAGFAPESAVLASGTGHCRNETITSREQG